MERSLNAFEVLSHPGSPEELGKSMDRIRPPASMRLDEEAGDTGLWKCDTCKNRFHGGGVALHKEGCIASPVGYAGCTFLVSKETLRTYIPRCFSDADVAEELGR